MNKSGLRFIWAGLGIILFGTCFLLIPFDDCSAQAVGGSITGQVTRASDGGPLEAVRIEIYDQDWDWVTYADSDSSGNYTAGGLAAGDYYLSTLNWKGYIDEWHDNIRYSESQWPPVGVTAVTVTEGSTGNVNFVLILGGSISGRVITDPGGAGIDRVAVEVYDENGNFLQDSYTDQDGNYTVTGLPTGSYYVGTLNYQNYFDEYHDNVRIIDDQWPPVGAVTVAVTETLVTENIHFGLTLGGSISGRVTSDSDDTGIQGVTVWVYDANWNFVRSGWTDWDGYYSVGGLLTGDYYATTLNFLNYFDEWYNNVPYVEDQFPPAGATAVPVTESTNTANIHFELTLGGSISGRVTSDSDGTGIHGVTVQVYDETGISVASGWTDWEGNYTVGGLPAGNYYVGTLNGQFYFDEWYNNTRFVEGEWPPAGAILVAVAISVDTPNIHFGLTLDASTSFSFVDVPADYWAHTSIMAILNAGITGGCEQDNPSTIENEARFCPDDPVTRGQMAVFMETSLGRSPAASCTGMFSDVNAGTVGDLVCRYIEDFAVAGITGGCGGGGFCPNDPVTRGQMAVFIEAALSAVPAAACAGFFSDVDAITTGELFCRFIEDFAARGITSGCGVGQYCPQGIVTRAQMAAFLVAAPNPLAP